MPILSGAIVTVLGLVYTNIYNFVLRYLFLRWLEVFIFPLKWRVCEVVRPGKGIFSR